MSPEGYLREVMNLAGPLGPHDTTATWNGDVMSRGSRRARLLRAPSGDGPFLERV